MSIKRASRRAVVAAVVGGALIASAPAQAENIVVNTTADTTPGLLDPPACQGGTEDCSLRSAIDKANEDPGLDTIRLADDAVYMLSQNGSDEDGNGSGDLDITSTVKIVGNDSTLDANGIDRAIDLLPGGDLNIKRINITGGAPEDGASGGAIRTVTDLLLIKSSISDSVAEGEGASGGAIFNGGGKLVSTSRTSSVTAQPAPAARSRPMRARSS